MQKILSILGTRPEAIKMAPIIKELEGCPQFISLVCVTGQHREMIDQALAVFTLEPDIDLRLMRENQSLLSLASNVLTEVEALIRRENPAWVLVQGDTTTAMAASLAACYSKVRVAHVEAGLRTYNRDQPFPEEINRRLTSVVANLHFAPTEQARRNLLCEAIPADDIVVTGNPVIDSLRWVMERPTPPTLTALSPLLSAIIDDESSASLVLVTAHRRENFGQPLFNICVALRELAAHYGSEILIVYPVHLNPNVWQSVHECLAGIENILLLPPVDYVTLVHLMKHARVILTDSGGIQEEAPSLGKPVLVLRDVTERPEPVEAGISVLVGTETDRIVRETRRLLDDPDAVERVRQVGSLYGDGHASRRIVAALLERQ